MVHLLSFEWEKSVDGYEIVEHEAKPDSSHRDGARLLAPEGSYLRAKGSRFLRYRPLEESPGLFREFADLDESAESVCGFANRYGLLGWITRKQDPSEEDPVILWYDHIRSVRHAVEAWEARQFGQLADAWNKAKLGRSSIKLDYGPGWDHPALTIVPMCLISAIWIQFAQAISGNVRLAKCAVCPTWFVYGTGTGRRRTSMYCSPRCRTAAFRARQERGEKSK